MKKVLFVIALFIFSITTVNAYTKQDIMTLSNSFTPCDAKSRAAFNAVKSSYERILNERDVSQENLNKIYNNIKEAKNYLTSHGICKIDDKSKVDAQAKQYFYALYQSTNSLLLNSPKLSDGSVPNTQVVIDPNNGQLDIYENGRVSEKITANTTLNNVGLNSSFTFLYVEIIVFTILFSIILFIMKKKKIRSKFFTALVFVNILLFVSFTLFRDEISIGMDLVDKMSLEKASGEVKKVVVNDKKILSYPSFGEKYAKIKIFDESSDIYFGDSPEVLTKGVGQSSQFNFVGEGKTVISGHNTGFFENLFNLNESDKVTIETIYGKFEYEVKEIDVIDYTNVASLEKDYDLILYTCYPKVNIYGNQRLMVYLKKTSESWVGDTDE